MGRYSTPPRGAPNAAMRWSRGHLMIRQSRLPRLCVEIDVEAAGSSSRAHPIRLIHYVPGHGPFWPQETRRTTKRKAFFRALCFLWLDLLRQGETVRSSAVGPGDASDSSLKPSTNGRAASSRNRSGLDGSQQRPAGGNRVNRDGSTLLAPFAPVQMTCCDWANVEVVSVSTLTQKRRVRVE